MKIKHVFRISILLIFFSCNQNNDLRNNIITNKDEFWVVDDFSEVGHYYGYKFNNNKYAYYIILEKDSVFRRFESNAEGLYEIKNDSIINYYFEGKIIFLNKEILKIKLKNGKIKTYKKMEFVEYTQEF